MCKPPCLSHDRTHYLITGEKKYATNAAIAGVLTVMAKTAVEENGKIREKVTAFLVTPDLPGFEVVKNNRSKMGVRGSWQGVLRFTDMPVPRDRVLGEVGKGLKVALGVLNYGRCTLSAGCVGGAKRALELTVQRAMTRRQFGRTLSEFHLVKQKIARMAETLYAMESMTYLCAGLVDRHEGDIMLETAISKLFCSESLWTIADDCLQVWGGEGYMQENGIERMVRDARINRIVEGATEVMSAFIALAGMKGVGEEFESVLRQRSTRLATLVGWQSSPAMNGSTSCGATPLPSSAPNCRRKVARSRDSRRSLPATSPGCSPNIRKGFSTISFCTTGSHGPLRNCMRPQPSSADYKPCFKPSIAATATRPPSLAISWSARPIVTMRPSRSPDGCAAFSEIATRRR